MQQRPQQYQEEQHVQLSLNSLGALTSYWPSRAPLGFAAAHPRCRIAAEARLLGTYIHDDAESEYEAAWTDWARQVPFGDWWVSDLAERMMPSKRRFASEVPFTDAAADIVDDARWYSDHAPNTLAVAANATSRGGERRCAARPHPPGTASASPSRYMLPQRRACTYFEHKQQRGVTAAAAIATGAVHSGLDSEDSLRDVSSLPEYPYAGTNVRCAAMRAGYLGGVLVGHLVSFLVRSTAADAGQYISNPSSTVSLLSTGLAAQEHAQLQWRRVLHWEVGVEREEERRRKHAAAPICSNACEDAAPSSQKGDYPGGSWMYSHWWLSRPLVLGRACVPSSPPPCSRFAHEDIRNHVEDDGIHQVSYDPTCAAAAAPPSTSLYAYAVHLYECQAPPALPSPSLSATSDNPAHWWSAFLRCPCCAHLRILDVNFEGARARKLEGWAMVAAPVGSAGQAAGRVSPPSASPRLKPLDLQASNDGSAPSDAPSRRFLLERRQLQRQTITSGTDCASSARPHLRAPVLRYVTEVHLTSSATLQDVGFLGELPVLRLADVSFNTSLTDAGVHGLCRSTSLRVIDVSYCPQVDAAAAELVRCLVELEELYLSGTGLTDATLRTVAAHLRSSGGTPHDALLVTETGAPASGQTPHSPRPGGVRRLRVLHACACRRVRNPYNALAPIAVMQRNERRQWRGGGVAHGQSCWAGLQELRLAAVDMGELHHESDRSRSGSSDASGTQSEDIGSEVGAATERVADAADEGAGLLSSLLERGQGAALPQTPGRSLPVVSSSSLPSRGTAAPVEKAGAAAKVTATTDVPRALTTPPSLLWQRLTTLVFTDTKFRCALGDVGRLPFLQCLSLLRCSVEEGARLGAGEGAHRPWLSGLEQSALLHTVHLDGCSASAIRDAGSLQILARLPSLQNVSLSHTDIRDADLDVFVAALCESGATAPQHQFHRLCLRSCGRITNVGAVALLSSVRFLDLSDTAVRQEVLDALGNSSAAQHPGGLHALQALNCSACSLILDLSPVAHLRHLRWLNVSHTPLSTAAVAALRFCAALTHLTLKNCAGVHHVRDVMAIATLEVLNVQGWRRSFMPGTPPYNFSNPLAHRDDSHALEEGIRSRSAVADVFPGDDEALFTSSLHTLLLSHTRVRRIRRLGLLPSLMCLDLNNTAVTDAELVKFVCTGVMAADKRASDARSPHARNPPVVVHSLRARRLDECAGRGCRGPPLRLLSLQFCRRIFSVGVLGLCPHLTKLDVSSSNVTSQGLIGLHRSTSLVQMRLLSCKGVHDMRALHAIPSLAEVDGSGCNVHSGRITGAGVRGGSGTHVAAGAESGSAAEDIAAVRRATEGTSFLTIALLQASTSLSSPLGLTRGCQKLVLDGCVNICSFLELSMLSSLLELSLCNCHGITAASVAELISLSQWCSRASGTDSAQSVVVSSVLPLSAPFPSLRTLRLSSCRNLTGSLAGLELLPQLRCVHADRCGITSVYDVIPALQSRVVL
ncbi:Leucine Rich repeat family protein [Leishmania donovani]|uniref:Leucine Rich repeat family protein n=1 Tax=Leishmania donovani TaxID=5661 RepID=A0A504X2X8_LEIDO|nr:Leucine Rich repeat family protein [Leishmania donovani]